MPPMRHNRIKGTLQIYTKTNHNVMGVNQSVMNDVYLPSSEELGNELLATKEYLAAVENFKKVSPMTDIIRIRMIKAYDKINSHDEITTIASQITSAIPADTAFIIANAHHEMNLHELAISYATTAINLAPSKGVYRMLLGRIYYDMAVSSNNKNHYFCALEQYNILYSTYANLSNQNFAVVQMYRGFIFNRFGNYTDAIAALEIAYEKTVNWNNMLMILTELSISYNNTNKYFDSVQNYDIILNSPRITLSSSDREKYIALRNESQSRLTIVNN